MGTLSTHECIVLKRLIKSAVPVTGKITPAVEAELGLLHERALEALEDDRIREDEFSEIRDILRGYGLMELFC